MISLTQNVQNRQLCAQEGGVVASGGGRGQERVTVKGLWFLFRIMKRLQSGMW